MSTEVTEHTIEGTWCPTCKKVVEPVVSDALPGSNLCLYLLIVTAWLHYGLGITIGNILKWLSRICQMRVSAGGFCRGGSGWRND
ncbi:MAG: hypothetical protein DSO00_08490 [Archaeoglobi archaeon]|nr:MAG: hypothetical protein DSO00_08490 [Archaeoglobi archaeon]